MTVDWLGLQFNSPVIHLWATMSVRVVSHITAFNGCYTALPLFYRDKIGKNWSIIKLCINLNPSSKCLLFLRTTSVFGEPLSFASNPGKLLEGFVINELHCEAWIERKSKPPLQHKSIYVNLDWDWWILLITLLSCWVLQNDENELDRQSHKNYHWFIPSGFIQHWTSGCSLHILCSQLKMMSSICIKR